MSSQAPSYRGYRFPSEIISHAVWLYYRFALSFRDVEDLLAQRSITVTYETIRQWCLTFGADYARTLRHRRGRQGDTWHLDELFVTLNGRLQYLWRAVDEDGDVLDILVQSRRNRRAAVRFFRKLLKTPRLCPSSTDHRQASQLPGSVPWRDAVGGPLHGSVCEQPRRGLAPTDATTGTPDASLQVGRPSTTLRVGPRRGPESVPRGSTPVTRSAPSPTANPGVRRVGSGDVCLLTEDRGRVNQGENAFPWLNLTEPFSVIRYSFDAVRMKRLSCAMAGVAIESSFSEFRPRTSNVGPARMT